MDIRHLVSGLTFIPVGISGLVPCIRSLDLILWIWFSKVDPWLKYRHIHI